jgi:hypothetical protein
LSPQLTAERLTEYLEGYFQDRETFSRVAEIDVRNSRRSEPGSGPAEDVDGGVGE